MVEVFIQELCKLRGSRDPWTEFKTHVICAKDVREAKKKLKAYLCHIYNVSRRKKAHRDTKSHGTLHVGYVYSGIEGANILQAWCSFYDHKTRLHINPSTGDAYYAQEET